MTTFLKVCYNMDKYLKRGGTDLAVLEIVKVGSELLRQQTETVPKVTKKIVGLIADMIETMYAADGVGLAAPQVGILLKIIVVDVGEGPFALINPRIIKAEGEEIDVEGCLSVPGKQGYVRRAAKVWVDALDEKGKNVRIEAQELLARALQHEIDHLNGVLYIDLLEEEIPDNGVKGV